MFETWGEFKNFCRKDGKTVDDYIMCHEKCKVKMRRFKMDLRGHMYELNLLRGAKAMCHIILYRFLFHITIPYSMV